MSSRHKIYWRVYIYANSLYSLPARNTCSFRPWSPMVFRPKSHELQRIMIWVNRDLSVLLRNLKWEMLAAYDAILDLLPFVNMKSQEFTETVQLYLGDKTLHFVHELINFARSPYDDLISYECNVQYCPIDKLVQKVKAGTRTKMTTDPDLHSFVEFSSRINDDDCSGFEADLDQDNEDWEDEIAGTDGSERQMILRRTPTNNIQASQMHSPQLESPQPIPVLQRSSQREFIPHPQAQPQPQQQQPLPQQQPESQLRRYIPAFGSHDLEVAIERSMVNGQGDDNGFYIPNSNNIFMALPHFGREPSGPSNAMSAPPPPPMPIMHQPGVHNNRGGGTRRIRRHRKVGWGDFNMQ